MIVHAHVNIDSMNRGRWADGCLFSLTSDVFEGHFSSSSGNVSNDSEDLDQW